MLQCRMKCLPPHYKLPIVCAQKFSSVYLGVLRQQTAGCSGNARCLGETAILVALPVPPPLAYTL